MIGHIMSLGYGMDTAVGRFACGTLVLCILTIIVIGLLCFLRKKEIKLHILFIVSFLLLSGMYILALPTFTAPDEGTHFFSAYRVSNEMCNTNTINFLGFFDIRESDMSYSGNADGSLTVDTYERYAKTFKLTGTESNLMISFHPADNQTPVANWVPALGITLGRRLGLSFGWVMIIGKLFQMVFFMTAAAYAIYKIPYGKGVIYLVASLPITMQQVLSYSYDCQLMAASLVIIALSIYAWDKCRSAYCDNRPTANLGIVNLVRGMNKFILLIDLLLFLGASYMLLRIKSAYAAILILLPFLLSLRLVFAHIDKKTRRVSLLIVLAIMLVLALAMYVLGLFGSIHFYLYSWHEVPFYNSVSLPMIFYIQHPIVFVRIMFDTIRENFAFYIASMMGGLFSDFSVVVPRQLWHILVILAVLVAIAPAETARLTLGNRISLILTGGFIVLFSFLGMLIAWTPFDSELIMGVQGRYFLPGLPVILLGLGFWKNRFIPLSIGISSEGYNRIMAFLITSVTAITAVFIFSAVRGL